MKRAAWAWAVAGLAILTWGLFHRALDGQFLAFDDDHNITLNAQLGSLNAATAKWAFTDFSHARRYLPLGWLSFSALLSADGFDPRVFHFASLLLHVANTVLLLVLLRRLAGDALGATAPWLILLLAAWWAWHPLRVEAVAWSSAFLYVAATTWMLVAAICFLAGFEGRRTVWLVLAVLAYAASLLTYAVWLGAPLALFAAGWWRLRRAGVDAAPPARRAAWTIVPFVVLAGAALVANFMARAGAGEQWGGMVSAQANGWLAAAARSLATIGWFLLKIVWPVQLTPADDRWAAGDLAPAPLLTGLAALLLLLVIAWGMKRRHGGGPLLVGLAFALVELPLAGATEQSYALSDRYTYSGQLVLVAGLAVALARSRGTRAGVALLVFGALTLAGAGRAWVQIPVWHDSDRLFAHVSATARHESIRQFFVERWREVRVSAGDSAAVAEELQRGLPPPPSARLTSLLAEAGRLEREAVASGAENTIEANAHHHLAREAWERDDRRLALAHLARAVALAPRNWPAWADYGVALGVSGQVAAARRVRDLIPAAGAAAACRQRVSDAITVVAPGS